MSVGKIFAAIENTCVTATIRLIPCIKRMSRYAYL